MIPAAIAGTGRPWRSGGEAYLVRYIDDFVICNLAVL